MATFLFVHGTGNREEDVARTVKVIGTKLDTFDRSKGLHSLKFCYWGGELGTPPRNFFHSIPDYEDRGGNESVEETEESKSLWELLYADPFFEINLQAIKASGVEEENKAIEAMRNDLKIKLHGLAKPDGKILALLQEGQIDRHFETCRKRVSDSAEWKALTEVAVPPMGPYRKAVARTICALSVIASNGELIFPTFQKDRDIRKQIIDGLTSAMGGLEGFIPAWVVKPFIRGFERHVRRQFGRYVRENYKFVGDVLLYQTKGVKIREAIKAKISECEPPVVLIGHSLGGIAAFDMLVEEAKLHPNQESKVIKKMKMLVTVGSQVPFLYEINCLQSLRNDGKPEQAEQLPPAFPKLWLNCYDPNDLLSYVAQGAFPPDRVKDVPVTSNSPFPESHSAYWQQETMWRAIEASL